VSVAPMAIVSPAFHETPGALRNVGGSAGVVVELEPEREPYAIGLPCVSGWDRTARWPYRKRLVGLLLGLADPWLPLVCAVLAGVYRDD
jgi:hypothetical protein